MIVEEYICKNCGVHSTNNPCKYCGTEYKANIKTERNINLLSNPIYQKIYKFEVIL